MFAQTVVAGVLEERAERLFHPDSYGYWPPGRILIFGQRDLRTILAQYEARYHGRRPRGRHL